MCLQPITGPPSEPDRLRPNVPITQSASIPIPIPICNGCGTTSNKVVLLPSTSVGKTGRKYGQLQLLIIHSCLKYAGSGCSHCHIRISKSSGGCSNEHLIMPLNNNTEHLK